MSAVTQHEDGATRFFPSSPALGVSSETVRRWIPDRRLAAQIIRSPSGRAVTIRIRPPAVEAFERRWVGDTIEDDWE